MSCVQALSGGTHVTASPPGGETAAADCKQRDAEAARIVRIRSRPQKPDGHLTNGAAVSRAWDFIAHVHNLPFTQVKEYVV